LGLLGKLFGSSKTATSSITPAMAEKIVQDYGAALGTSAPPAGGVADARALPHPKARIKEALVFALHTTSDANMRKQLITAYLALADWQDGVGATPLGIDLTKMDLQGNPDVANLAKKFLTQNASMEKWRPQIEAEQRVLLAELQNLGY
jgi:hypothetical protein